MVLVKFVEFSYDISLLDNVVRWLPLPLSPSPYIYIYISLSIYIYTSKEPACGELPVFRKKTKKDNRRWVADQEPVNMKRLEP